MSRDELQALRDFRSDAPAPDAETASRIYELATGTRMQVRGRPHRRRPRLVRRAALAGAAAVAATALVTLGSPGSSPAVEDAAAAVERAAGVTAASANASGTALVRITHNGERWAGKTIRWNGADLSVEEPRRHGRPGAEFLLVDGRLYTIEDGGWVAIGSPASIDPDSGTTPDELLTAVRDDIGGATLRRLTDGLAALRAEQLAAGSTVYSGTVAAGLIVTESGFKDGQAIRVFPFGYVAHGEAADPTAALDATVTVGADGVIREIAVTWGASASAWTYTVAYSSLGETPPPVAPANARDLLRDRLRAADRAVRRP